MKNIKIFLTFLCLFAVANFASAQKVGDSKMYQGIISTNSGNELIILTKLNGVNTYIKINNPQKAQVLIDNGSGFLPALSSRLKIGDTATIYGKIRQINNGLLIMDAGNIMSSDVSSFFDVWAEMPSSAKKSGASGDVSGFFDVFLESVVGRAKAGNKNSQQLLNSFFDVWAEMPSSGKTTNVNDLSDFFDVWAENSTRGRSNRKGELGGASTSTATTTPPRQPSTGEGRGSASTSTPPSPKPTPTPTSTPGKQSATGNSAITPIIPIVNTNIQTFTIPSTNTVTPTQTVNTNSIDSFFDVFLESPSADSDTITINNLGAGMVYTQCPYFRCPWLYLNQ